MKKQFTILVIALLSLINYCAAVSKATLVEKIKKVEKKYVIPYEKYKLENGLTLIIHEDHTDPIVHVEVVYHVGSARDEPGRSGFAHFFEHMMFEGSEHVKSGEHSKIIHEAGGDCNGSTSHDRTVYYETIPSNFLETALWLESDRMGFFINAVSEKRFELERSTIKNERAEAYENRVNEMIHEKINSTLYEAGNPYFAPIIGFTEDIDKADFNDLKKFFLRWYCPNNAVIIISGDVNTAETVILVEKYFGSINPGKPAERLLPVQTKLESTKFVSYEDNIRNPCLEIVYPTVPVHDTDEVSLDLLSEIMGGEGSSLIGAKLLGVLNPIGSYVEVSHPCLEASGYFQISVKLQPGKSLEDAYDMVHKVFREFEKRGIKDDDILYFKSNYRKKFLERIETVKEKAQWLGYYEIMHGNPNMFHSEYERYMSVNTKDVMKAYEKYIKNKPAVVVSVYPKGNSRNVVDKDNYVVPKLTDVLKKSENNELVYKKPIEDFDRSKRPVPGPVPTIKPPEIWKHQFDNGLKVYGINDESIPRIMVKISVDAGHSYEPLEKAGIGILVSSMFNESAADYSGYYYMTELLEIGSEIYIDKNSDDIEIVITSTRDNLFRTFTLLEEKMFSLKFYKYEFDWEKKRLLDYVGQQNKIPAFVADNVFLKLLYGPQSIYSKPFYGTRSTVNKISLTNVKKYFKENFNAGNANIVVVGDVSKEDIIHKLKFLSNWGKTNTKKSRTTQLPVIDKTRLYFIRNENAVQSEIRIGRAAATYDPMGEYFKCILLNYPFGVGLNSRLNQKLRGEKGVTYDVSSRFFASKYTGQFLVNSSVQGENTDSAVIDIMNQIKLYSEKGITDEELKQAKSSLFLQNALSYESSEEKSSYLWKLLYYNLKPDYISQQQRVLIDITKEEINSLAKKYFTYDSMIILVIGDSKYMPNLKKLPFDFVEVDVNGNEINDDY